MRNSISLWMLLALGSSTGGCFFGGRGGSIAPQSAAVAPLSEADFDEFTSRTAKRLVAVISAIGVAMPASLPMPQLIDETPGGSSLAPEFARSFTAGLNDRLLGKVRLVPMVPGSTQWKSTIVFRADGYGSATPRISFSLSDSRGPTEVLHETAGSAGRYASGGVTATGDDHKAIGLTEPAPAAEQHEPSPAGVDDEAPRRTNRPAIAPRRAAERPARAPATDAPVMRPRETPRPAGRIKIDDRGSDFGAYVRDSMPLYQEVVRAGSHGRLVFLDSRSYERFWIQSQRADRTMENRLKVDLDIRARGRARDGEYRIIFYDENDEPVEATNVLSAEFSGDYAQTLSVTASSSTAQRYICLFQED